MKAMVDTSVLIAGMPEDIIREIEYYCSSTICRGELAHGLFTFQRDPAREREANARAELLRLLDALPAFWQPFDRAASDAYGGLTAVPHSAIRLKDALIAGHAFSLDLPIITVDAGFSRFPDVRVLDKAY